MARSHSLVHWALRHSLGWGPNLSGAKQQLPLVGECAIFLKFNSSHFRVILYLKYLYSRGIFTLTFDRQTAKVHVCKESVRDPHKVFSLADFSRLLPEPKRGTLPICIT